MENPISTQTIQAKNLSLNPKRENTSRLGNLKKCNIMEVRIKDNNGYVDADWTIEDGVMVVSPKVERRFYE